MVVEHTSLVSATNTVDDVGKKFEGENHPFGFLESVKSQNENLSQIAI